MGGFSHKSATVIYEDEDEDLSSENRAESSASRFHKNKGLTPQEGFAELFFLWGSAARLSSQQRSLALEVSWHPARG